MDRIKQNIENLLQSVKAVMSSIYSYIAALFTLIITHDTAVLYAFFFIFFLLDYVTGILASYIENKNKEPKVYVIESERLRDSGVKAIGYMIVIIFSWFITKRIVVNPISIFGLTAPLTVHQIALAILGVIEAWSNLENIKRCGFDVIGSLKNVITGVKSIKDEVNTLK